MIQNKDGHKLIIRIFFMILVSSSIFDNPGSKLMANPVKLRFGASDSIKYLNIPDRSENAKKGSEFVDQVSDFNLQEREQAVVNEILSGNVPSFSRELRPITINKNINAENFELEIFTVSDYMAIGSEQDYLYIPMTPSTAQYLANALDCTLPTKKMVDIIYNNAGIKLSPQPIPPSDQMTTIPVFSQHTDSIKQQIVQKGIYRSKKTIFGGHKKDIIISNKIYSADRTYDRVVIYGWHRSQNDPIQPVYNGHIAMYADYSHGVRYIADMALLNGDSTRVLDILQHQTLNVLLSNEGKINKPYYPESDFLTSMGSCRDNLKQGFILNQNYPNPFNPSTIINYQLTKTSLIDLSVFNILGEKVATLASGEQPVGRHEVSWNALSFANGVYVYKLKTGYSEQTRKMILLR